MLVKFYGGFSAYLAILWFGEQRCYYLLLLLSGLPDSHMLFLATVLLASNHMCKTSKPVIAVESTWRAL